MVDYIVFYYVPQTKFGRHIVFAPFLIIKSPNEVWRLIVFAPFLIIIIIKGQSPYNCRLSDF